MRISYRWIVSHFIQRDVLPNFPNFRQLSFGNEMYWIINFLCDIFWRRALVNIGYCMSHSWVTGKIAEVLSPRLCEMEATDCTPTEESPPGAAPRRPNSRASDEMAMIKPPVRSAGRFLVYLSRTRLQLAQRVINLSVKL